MPGELSGGPSAQGSAQRERLLDAMIELSADVGYPRITVASLSAHAGVSTASFYEFFSTREACLLAACAEAARRILGDPPLRPASGCSDPLRLVLEHALSASRADPHACELLFLGALAGRPPAWAERARAFRDFELALEPILEDSLAMGPLDLPAPALTGALSALLRASARPGADFSVAAVLEDLLAWARSFAIPSPETRRSVADVLLPLGSDRALGPMPPACARARRLPRGRHRLPRDVVDRHQRERVIQGLAEAVTDAGYEDVTVTDIVARAGVARGVFYRHFASKQDAFLAAQDLGGTELVRELARAYFCGSAWPERVWRVLDALAGFVAANPALAHIRLLDCYAAGPRAVRAAERARSAAAVLLFEGFPHLPGAAGRPDRLADASAGAIFELLQRDIMDGEIAMLRRRLPQLTYLAIAPFLGAAQARRVLDALTSTICAALAASS